MMDNVFTVLTQVLKYITNSVSVIKKSCRLCNTMPRYVTEIKCRNDFIFQPKAKCNMNKKKSV